jgi:N-acetylated-alpha-linked acidic dipeptidase
MKRLSAIFFVLLFLLGPLPAQEPAGAPAGYAAFRNPQEQQKWEQKFLLVPDPKRAEDDLRTLTAAPHLAGSPEDKKTAEFVARKFREAGLQTEIVEYKVWMNTPAEISVSITSPGAGRVVGPHPESVPGDPYENDPRVVMPFSGYSPSGDVEGEAVYANYGRPEDFEKLALAHIDVRGKIVVMRYGQNFRGVKSFLAEQHGAAGVILYSDPIDDGFFKGDPYPAGPWRPESGVQRGSIGYTFEYSGDPTTPGVASVPSLPDSQRVPPAQAASLPKIPTTPLSWGDAQPILQLLAGPESPREWQGALPFTYHLGPGPVKVRMHLKQKYEYRTLWDVIGKIPGSDPEQGNQWVVAGNHRDAWVYGAVDPNSGTAAMLEAVRGLGELLKSGWRPKRTLVIGSWDGEEQGLIGSTEWAEQNFKELSSAAAYLNVDVAVSGPNFGASAVPSLKQFVRDVTRVVPSPQGDMLYEVWRRTRERQAAERASQAPSAVTGAPQRMPAAHTSEDVPVGDLGSGSDYTPFLQHLGVPATDIGSSGPYGVYHSAFDDFQWFTRNADPHFLYEQEMARVFGMEVLRMADADVLPYDYQDYGREIAAYVEAARKKSIAVFGDRGPDFAAAAAAAQRFEQAGAAIAKAQQDPKADAVRLNRALAAAEKSLLLPQGLPHRPWFRHAIYAPGEYTGYAAVVIPGVNEALDARDAQRARQQLAELTAALERAAQTLESYR